MILTFPNDGNVQIDDSTGLAVLFDPCCFYGHNESQYSIFIQILHQENYSQHLTVEFQCMRAARNSLGSDFVAAYKNEVDASEPQEDFDDRNALY